MKFGSVLAFALTLGVSVAAPVEVRQTTPTVEKDLVQKIAVIQSKLITLNKTVSTLKQGDFLTLAKALQVQSQSTDVENAIKAATTSANKTPKLDDDQSFNVAAPILDLIPAIQQTLDNIVVKKPVFATAVFGFGDLSKTVLKSLQSQRALTKTFGDAVTAKLSDQYAELAPSILDTILGYFDTAIAAYQKCTGKVCLPPFPSISFPAALPKPGSS